MHDLSAIRSLTSAIPDPRIPHNSAPGAELGGLEQDSTYSYTQIPGSSGETINALIKEVEILTATRGGRQHVIRYDGTIGSPA